MTFERIDIDVETGSVQGYAVDADAEQIPNWLADQIGVARAEQLAAHIRASHRRVAIIKNLNVDEEHRGRGIGSGLLLDALDEAGADVVLLVSDAHEAQRAGFALQGFYERHDFAVVCDTGAGPCMAYPAEAAEALRAVLEPTAAFRR